LSRIKMPPTNKVFHGSFNAVSRMYQGYSNVFGGCFMGVLRVLSKQEKYFL